jgi:hypothetical protein
MPNVPILTRLRPIFECIPEALILCNAQTSIGTMLSIVSNILKDPARMYGQESKDFSNTGEEL